MKFSNFIELQLEEVDTQLMGDFPEGNENINDVVPLDNNAKKKFEFFEQELVISLSFPYRKRTRFKYKGVYTRQGESLTIRDIKKNNSKNNKNGKREIIGMEIDLSEIEKVGDIRVPSTEMDIIPVLSFILYLDFRKYHEKKKESIPRVGKLIYGAFHLDLGKLLGINHRHTQLKGHFDQEIEGVGNSFFKTTYGSLILSVKSINKEILSVIVGKNKINMLRIDDHKHDNESSYLHWYNNEIDLLKKFHDDVESSLEFRLDRKTVSLYDHFYYIMASRFLVPVEFFPLLSLYDLHQGSHVEDNERLFLNLLEITEKVQKREESFWTMFNHLLERKNPSQYTDHLRDFANEECSVFMGHFLRSIVTLLPYCKDYSFMGSSLKESDVYSDIFTNGEGDCEDFSISVYRMIFIFSRLKTRNTKLQILQRYLDAFMPFICKMIVDETKEENTALEDMILHTVCVLIPKQRISFENMKEGSPFQDTTTHKMSHILNCVLLDCTSRSRVIYRSGDQITKYEKTFYTMNWIMKSIFKSLNDGQSNDILRNIYYERNGLLEKCCGEAQNLFDDGEYLQNLDSSKKGHDPHPFYRYVLSLQTHYFVIDSNINNEENRVLHFFVSSTEEKNRYPMDFIEFMKSDDQSTSKMLLVPGNQYPIEKLKHLTEILNIEQPLSFPKFGDGHITKDFRPNGDGPSGDDQGYLFELNVTDIPDERVSYMLSVIKEISDREKLYFSIHPIDYLYYGDIKDRSYHTILFEIIPSRIHPNLLKNEINI